MKRLGINIDHVATLRNARGEKQPSPILTANYLKKKNVDSVTINLSTFSLRIFSLTSYIMCSL